LEPENEQTSFKLPVCPVCLFVRGISPLFIDEQCSIVWVAHSSFIYLLKDFLAASWSIFNDVVRKMIFSIKVFVTLLDYLKITQVTILGDLHV
jgi:hypothetical protein